MNSLKKLEISGFKSIRHQELTLGSLNVLIGANGAGKSNLISFLQMLERLVEEKLQSHVGRAGGANSLLHYGAKATPHVEGALSFGGEDASSVYHLRLSCGAPDALVLDAEEVCSTCGGSTHRTDLGAGRRETQLSQAAEEGDVAVRVMRDLMGHWQFFHFRDWFDRLTGLARGHGEETT